LLALGSSGPIVEGTMAGAQWWECLLRSVHRMVLAAVHFASCTQTHQSLCAFHTHRDRSNGLMLAHTRNCEWKGSKNRILASSFLGRLYTALTNRVAAQSTTRSTVLGIGKTRDANSLVYLVVDAHRMPPRARPQTSSCSGHPGWHITWSRWLFSAFP
jgi:hypothetical protein